MRRRKDDCTRAGSATPGTLTPPPNAFTDDLFAALDERDLEPAVPEGHLPGPWRVTRLWGDGPPPLGRLRPRRARAAADLL